MRLHNPRLWMTKGALENVERVLVGFLSSILSSSLDICIGNWCDEFATRECIPATREFRISRRSRNESIKINCIEISKSRKLNKISMKILFLSR